jgi:hypothetical protein
MYDRDILNFNLTTQRLGRNSMTSLSYQGVYYQLDHHGWQNMKQILEQKILYLIFLIFLIFKKKLYLNYTCEQFTYVIFFPYVFVLSS